MTVKLDATYSPSNYTAASAELNDHLEGIDDELGALGGGGGVQYAFTFGASASASTTRRLFPGCSDSAGTPTAGRYPSIHILDDGTVDMLIAANEGNTAGSTTNRVRYTVWKYTTATDTWAATSLTADCAGDVSTETIDSTHSFSVVRGDRIAVETTFPDGGATSINGLAIATMRFTKS